jgi:hypothetical protein
MMSCVHGPPILGTHTPSLLLAHVAKHYRFRCHILRMTAADKETFDAHRGKD